jgi:hypothetical protein
VEAREKRGLSPLAEAIAGYVEKNPRERQQASHYLGLTVWALGLYDGHPTNDESRAAVAELDRRRWRGLAA